MQQTIAPSEGNYLEGRDNRWINTLGISRRALQYKLKEYGLLDAKEASGVVE